MCIIDEDHMIYGSRNIRCSRQNFLLFWAMFCTFTPLKTWKIKIVTNKKKNTRRYYHFTHVHHKWQSYDVWFLRYGAQWTDFSVILDHFYPFQPWKSKFWKNEKNSRIYHHFTHAYHKWQTYDVWFIRYGAWQAEFFVIPDHFFALLTP